MQRVMFITQPFFIPSHSYESHFKTNAIKMPINSILREACTSCRQNYLKLREQPHSQSTFSRTIRPYISNCISKSK